MNEDFFTGFDKKYLFFDGENDFLMSFLENGQCEVSLEDSLYTGKWRYLKSKNLLEIYSEDGGFKIIYKLKILKEDKEDNSIYLTGRYVVKYDDITLEAKKGDTTIIRNINDLSEAEDKDISTFENRIVLGVFFIIFFILLFISSFLPFTEKTGLIYSGAIIIVLMILCINKIKKTIIDLLRKYKDAINDILFE